MNDVVRGTVTPGFELVADAFRAFFTKAWDVGSAVSVYLRGEPVVRLAGGSLGCTRRSSCAAWIRGTGDSGSTSTIPTGRL